MENFREIPQDILNDWLVLVIDDEPDSLYVASYILRAHGANVHTAMDGEQALALIHENQPNFIISDLSMPVMDGWEMMDHLQRDRALAEIPVIALTAHAMLGDRERALAAGFYNYITKPLSADTFIQDVMRILVDIPSFSETLRLKLS